MFHLMESQPKQTPAKDISLSQNFSSSQGNPVSQNRRRSSYLQRLGIQNAGEADVAPVDSSMPQSAAGGAEHDFRKKYLSKLAYSNVWVPQAHRSPKHQTVVIFDWDDTLLCTTWLRHYNYQPNDSDETLRSIVQHSKTLLETAVRAGHTYVITNAMSGWVEYSAARWAPELLPALRKVRVISARDKFEADFPDDVCQWKIQAFLEVQRQLDSTPITNLVALGDADYEMEAARIMGDEFDEGLVKTVKFQPNPDPEGHLMQLALVAKNLERVIGSVRNLKVNLTRK